MPIFLYNFLLSYIRNSYKFSSFLSSTSTQVTYTVADKHGRITHRYLIHYYQGQNVEQPEFLKSNKLRGVCYDIRGPVLQEANRLEDEGHRIIKLNIGNPAPFGFEAPEEIVQDVSRHLHDSSGYSDSKGLFPARKAVMPYRPHKNISHLTVPG